MSEIILEQAKPEETKEILELYNELLDAMEEDVNYPKWTKNVYPNLEYLDETARKHQLYVARLDKEIIGSMILNNEMNKDYKKVNWSQEIPDEQVLTIHTFAIADRLRGQGLGLEVIERVKELAAEKGIRAIRFDTIRGNTPAVHLYEKAGFSNLGMHELHYQETPERWFNLFEYNLEEKNE